MNRERKPETDLHFNVEVGEDDKIIAFCTGCGTVIFKGTDATAVQNRVLRKCLRNHLEQTEWKHEIDIIYIKREQDAIINAEVYLSTPARLTARLGLKDLMKKTGRLL